MDYVPRIVDEELQRRLSSVGAVVIEGPKACGKTEMARQYCASEVLLDVDANARQAVAVAPGRVLEGPTPRLIDEWQLEPAIWNHIRRAVDDRGMPGQFIVTGSARPTDSITRHSGAGRLSRLRMRPMSLYETGHSTGVVSLSDLLEGETVTAGDPGMGIEDLAARITVGGWPVNLEQHEEVAAESVRDYLEEVCHTDIRQLGDTPRFDSEKVRRLTQSLARNVATEATAATLAADTAGQDGPLRPETVSGYLSALKRVMVIEDQPAWAPHLRSKSRLREAPKRHFADPSLAVAALGATASRLLDDLNLFGLLFESLVVRDLRIYAQAATGRVLHYRDNTGLEVDAIVETNDGRWAAFEVKLGGQKAIDEAAASLRRFADRVDTGKSGQPSALAVVVATGYGYVREDGIAVYPLTTLAP